jgi:hypothetical protein
VIASRIVNANIMSKQNNIPKNNANHQQNKSKSAKAKRNVPSKKPQELKIAQFTIQVGDTVYDVTDKEPNEFPDELKAALEPAQKLYAKLLVDSAWRRFYDNMPPEIRETFDSIPKSRQQELFRKWCENNLLNENK